MFGLGFLDFCVFFLTSGSLFVLWIIFMCIFSWLFWAWNCRNIPWRVDISINATTRHQMGQGRRSPFPISTQLDSTSATDCLERLVFETTYTGTSCRVGRQTVAYHWLFYIIDDTNSDSRNRNWYNALAKMKAINPRGQLQNKNTMSEKIMCPS